MDDMSSGFKVRGMLLGRMLCVALCAGLAGAAAEPAAGGTDSPGGTQRVIASAPGPIQLGASPVVVTPVVAAGAAGGGQALGDVLSRVASQGRVYLVLRGLTAKAPPGVLYHVYLDLPAGFEPPADDPRHVGTISFYEAVVPAGMQAPDLDRAPGASYEISATVRELQARGLLSGLTTVTIRPAGRPASGADPAVRALEMVTR
jgi:hypothetical protein